MIPTLLLTFVLTCATSPGEVVRSADDCVRLAEWCAARGHHAKADELARDAIALEKDHAAARARLGFVRVGDRWARKQAPPDHAATLKKVVDRDLKQLVSKEDQARDGAREALVRLAELEDLPGLAAEVEKIHADAGRFWKRQARALLEVRATNAKRVANRSWSTSLGTGAPVRFQLPELRTVRVGTTVPVPLGGG